MAGEPLQLTLFLQAQQSGLADHLLAVALRDQRGATVAGWEGWSPAAWPLSSWPAGALAQAPVTFDTPPTLAKGEYDLVAGFVSSAAQEQVTEVVLGQVSVYRRPAMFERPTIPQVLAEPVQFGVHVLLLGYNQERRGDEVTLTLYWQVLQTLLPPHHLFVHLDGPDGATLAQEDGPPMTASGPAPTGSWLPDEYLVTFHRLAPLPQDGDGVLLVGLYVPDTGVRLPASVAGQPSGDGARLPLSATR
jgi:hypothetical protein